MENLFLLYVQLMLSLIFKVIYHKNVTYVLEQTELK